MIGAMLAIGWEPWLRGVLVVIIMAAVLIGSVYIILATNMGGRLGFLVTLSALAGWMFLLGAVWWGYGQGLKGREPSWKPVDGQTIIANPDSLTSVGVITVPIDSGLTPPEAAAQASQALQDNGWNKLDPALAAYQQAGSSASVMVEESGAFKAGEFQVVGVYDKGGAAFPKFGPIDQLAFWHEPYYAIVEVAPVVPQRAEPGRAPARPIVDTSRSHVYVYMIRDLGNKRVPSAIICIASFIVFVITAWLLHRRDKQVRDNRAAKALPSKA